MRDINLFRGFLTTSVVIFALMLGACGGGDDSTPPGDSPVSVDPIAPGAQIASLPRSQALVGNTYVGKIEVIPNDARNRITGFQVINETAGGAPAAIDANGSISWVPNDLDFQGTIKLRATVQLETGPSEIYEFPVDVRKERVVLEVPLPASTGTLADPDGRYLIRVEPESVGAPMAGTLRIIETYASNGAYRFTVRVPLSSNARVTVLDAPSPLEVAPAVAAQRAAAGSERRRALSEETRVSAPDVRTLGVSPGLDADIGNAIGGDFLSGRHGLKAADNWNIYTTRLSPFYYSIDQNGFRDTKSADSVDLFQIDGNCSSIEACRSSQMKRAPVIMVHGFWPFRQIGGGDGTWNTLAEALSNVGHPVFEMRWNNYMRFEEAAGVLATLAQRVAEITGYRPHIVAHSFGGVVAHLAAMNKGIRFDGTQWKPVRTDGVLHGIITLGSPLSGIRYVPLGIPQNLTGGRDRSDLTITVCKSITCFQAGSRDEWDEDEISEMVSKVSAIDSAQIGLPSTDEGGVLEGATIRSLHDGWRSGGHAVPFSTVVSLKWRPGEPEMANKSVEALGDGLISMMGQAVDPYDFSAAPFVARNLLTLDLSEGKLGSGFIEALNNSTPSNMLRSNVQGRQYYFAVRAGHTSTKIQFYNGNDENDNLYPIVAYPENGRIDLDDLTDDHPLKHFIDSESHLAATRIAYGVENAAPAATVRGRTLAILNFGLPTPVAQTFSLQFEDASTGAAVTDQIVLRSEAGTGQFSFDAGLALAERFPLQSINVAQFKVVLRAGGDLDSARIIRRVNLGVDTDLGDITITPRNLQALAAARGTVIDGQTQNQAIAGAEVFFMKGLNQRPDLVVQVTDTATSRRVVSDDLGRFEVTGLEAGDYTVVVRKDGYTMDQQGRVVLVAGETASVGASILRILSASDAAITLRWSPWISGGLVSSDLDSHLLKYGSSGQLDYHISFRDRVGNLTDSLDRDDTDYEGPETITLTLDPASRYVYYVHLYSDYNATLPGSSPKVILRIGNEALDYDLSSSQATSARYWKIFEIVNGTVVPCAQDCLVDDEPN